MNVRALQNNAKELFTGNFGKALIVILAGIVLGYIISLMKVAGAGLPMGLAFLIVFSIVYIYNPKFGIYTVVFMGFATSALGRYFPFAPYGLSVDILLIATFLIVFFKRWKGFTLKDAKNDLSLVWTIWMVYIVLMIGNPLARSLEAWFYAMRGIALYSFLMIPLAFMIFNDKKDFERVFAMIFIFEIIGTLWAMKQMYIGVSLTEQRWLDAGAGSTHVLFGQLRAFSYFSDAAQFGASQAHIAFLSGVFAVGEPKIKKRIFYAVTCLLSLYGMIISGSRGPLVIPAIGGIVWLFLSKRHALFFSGLFVGLLIFGFLKFTTIAQSNYFVARMRTALNPTEDPSFIVRLEREKQLSGYLADKPIGGGVGSAGFWGKRFSPGTFLAEIGTDGHYTRIWMETGKIGLYLYLGIFFWIGFRVIRISYNLKDVEMRLKIGGLAASFVGLAVASYTNGLIVQIPTGPIVYLSLVFVYLSPKWEKEILAEKAQITPSSLK
ncbi:MAG: hypothetical protein CL843_12940 [Crocinitomicaceae bacterium]|nr:hypothetical protein [Crocinitomicaceae bacterium]